MLSRAWRTAAALIRLPWRTALLFTLYLMADIHTRAEFRRVVANDHCDEGFKCDS